MQTYLCEADVITGLEPLAGQELAALAAREARITRPGVIRFSTRTLRPLLELKTVLAVYLLRRYEVPRPRALLGDQHLRALLTQIDTVRSLLPRGAYRTFMLGAAGADSSVMTRLRSAIAEHTGLQEVNGEGDLLVRIRPASDCSEHARSQAEVRRPKPAAWDVLVRLSPQPLATRQWRVCNIAGSLQATVAHAMALLTRPTPDDVYLNVGCGSGTLLIERAMAGPARRLIGGDTDRQALACARENITAYVKGAPDKRDTLELHCWDMRRLPLPDASVDAITADLPFGHRVGSHDDNLALYPAMLREAARVARPGARCVLITAEVRLIERTLAHMPSLWQHDASLRVNLGGLRPAILSLRRK